MQADGRQVRLIARVNILTDLHLQNDKILPVDWYRLTIVWTKSVRVITFSYYKLSLPSLHEEHHAVPGREDEEGGVTTLKWSDLRVSNYH
jgi:hypothetical protein